jgi:hypothetical protein
MKDFMIYEGEFEVPHQAWRIEREGKFYVLHIVHIFRLPDEHFGYKVCLLYLNFDITSVFSSLTLMISLRSDSTQFFCGHSVDKSI